MNRDVNKKPEDASSLHVTALLGDKEGTEMYIANGADVNSKAEAGGWTPLHAAAGGGHEECTRLLISNGAIVYVKTEDEWTSLHNAACENQIEVARLLIDGVADVNATTEDGLTPCNLRLMKVTRNLQNFLLPTVQIRVQELAKVESG